MEKWRNFAKFVGRKCQGSKGNIRVGVRGLMRGSCNLGFVLCKCMGVWYCA
jgi:hypothetical protein